MDGERLAQLQELMKEARQNGQLERALLQSSVLPVPAPPSRRTIPLDEYQRMMAALPKQGAVGAVHVSEMALTIPEDIKLAAMSQMEQPGYHRPKAFFPPNSSLAQIPASSDKAPVAPPLVSTAATDPREPEGINRMRLAHERGDLPTVEEAACGRARAAIFRAGGIMHEAKHEAKAKHPGHVVAGYVNSSSNSPKRNKTVQRQPVVVSLCDNILEGETGSGQQQLPLRTEGAMTDASKRQRSPASSQFQERLEDFENDEWEEVDGPVPSYAPILDPEAGPLGITPGPYPPNAPVDARLAMANTHIPSDVMSYLEWGRTKITFGQTMKGYSYYEVAHGVDEKFYYYRRWARSHLEKKSLLGKDFIKYLAVKERYFGVNEDRVYLAAQERARVTRPTIPGPGQVRTYVAEDDIWNHGM